MILAEPPQPQGFPWTAFAGIVGTLAGFGLNELSYVVRGYREDRKKLGQPLTELLEIRHRLKLIPAAMNFLRSKVPAPIPPQAEFLIRNVFRSFLPDADAVRSRYEQAVTSIAGAFPVLAFELRTKNVLTPVLTQLAAIIQQGDTKTTELFVKLEDHLLLAALPVLENVIRKTAIMHGRKTRREVDSILQAKFELPTPFEKFAEQMLMSQPSSAHSPQTPSGTPSA
jgi:hypothetical protein